MDIQIREGRGPAEVLRTFREEHEQEARKRRDNPIFGGLMGSPSPDDLMR